MSKPRISVIIPAFNEEASIARVLADIPSGLVEEVLVCDNNSTDNTAEEAHRAGATVVFQPEPGYGAACLKGMEYLQQKPANQQPDIVVFLDGDYADHPEQMMAVVSPILEADFDLVIGSRALGRMEAGAMQPQQIFGNWLATNLIWLFFKYRFSDLGPFRAIKWAKLLALNMQDRNYGWTVEMQVKAAKAGLRCTEVPVDYRCRIGTSKVSGTLKGSILAGHKIIWTIFKNI